MSNSERVALVITEAVLGTIAPVDDKARHEAMTGARALLELFAQAVHWPRLLAEAEYRHAQLHDGTRPDAGTVFEATTGTVCGQCLREALLAEDEIPAGRDWHAAPWVERRGADVDWARLFAHLVAAVRDPDATDHFQRALEYVPIEDLTLDMRAYNVLTKSHRQIRFVGQLVELTEQDILDLRNAGTKTVANIQQRLREVYGLTLKPGDEEAHDAA